MSAKIHKFFIALTTEKHQISTTTKIRPSAGFFPSRGFKPLEEKTTGGLLNPKKPLEVLQWFQWKPLEEINTDCVRKDPQKQGGFSCEEFH